MLPVFFKKIWRCGSVVSVVSVLSLIASIFYFDWLLSLRSGMQGLHDKRMPIHEICEWQLWVFRAGCESCFVGAIFAMVGGVAYLASYHGKRS